MNTQLSLQKRTLNVLVFLFLFSSGAAAGITVGAERTGEYLPYLKNKRVGIVANQTTLIGTKNLVDSLLSLGVDVKKVLCPEHGFRGDADAGETIVDEKDSRTGLPVISLYRSGSQTQLNKPTSDDLAGLDILIFDFQDVGVRFYTNNSAMHYVMEACAENGLELLLLDRPNPHGFYMDGPMLDTAFRSFVGMHPVPVVHGMTMGEYAQMINGERWLKNGVQCTLNIIRCADYTHDSLYALPVPPSPNLPDMRSIYLYPSVCFFEGTVLSLGRGTGHPFQMFGHPSMKEFKYSFTPIPTRGAMNPPLRGRECFGVDLRTYDVNKIIASKRINLDWLIDAYRMFAQKDSFFIPYINTLAGSTQLRDQIRKGMTQEEIRKSWEPGLAAFRTVRQKYLLYPDAAPPLQSRIEQIVKRSRGTVGVAVSAMDEEAMHLVNDAHRFPMQSVYKFHLALAVLDRVDKGALRQDQPILVRKKDLLPNTWSPLREDFPDGNVTLPLSKILWYAVSISDNNACDILFRLVGGPRAVQSYIRSLGADSVAIVSTEEEMHRLSPLQFENWSTPSSAVFLLKRLYAGKILSERSRAFLLTVMTETTTGPKRLKGMLPSPAVVAHKTGSSGRGTDGMTAAVNDIGILMLPNGRSVAVAVFVSNSPDDDAQSERVIAEIAKAVWDHYSDKR